MFRIGHGYDVHRISTKNKPLFLGGILINAPFSLDSHSDGDIVLHAITDSILGAAALGDIGQHFPDTNLVYKDQRSEKFLLYANNFLIELGYRIANIDVTIVAQLPKINPYAFKMCNNISTLLKLKLNQINIKATTTEKLGFVGKKEGLACYAVTLIYQK